MIPKHWQQQYVEVCQLPRFPKTPRHALKTAIEEIGTLEMEKVELIRENWELKKRVKDLEDYEQDNKNLLAQMGDLNENLRQCQDRFNRAATRGDLI